MSEPTPAAPPPKGGPPLLVGPRARAGLAALCARIEAAGRPARVFGHPAAVPPNRDALAAALVVLVAVGLGLLGPAVARIAAGAGLFVTAALALGAGGWTRAAAWTVIVGRPVPGVTRRLRVLALDRRRPRAWLYWPIGLAALAALALPGEPLIFGLASMAVALSVWDPVRARDVSLDAAAEWVLLHPADPAELVLVSTAGSGEGEGIVAVTDWFKLDPQGIDVQIDEDGESGVRARLIRRGFGPKEAADVVAGARARG